VAFKVIFSEQSLNDLEDILDYISVDSPEAAARFGNDLLNHIELLAAFPRMGTPLPHALGIRNILHTPVRIYYHVNEDQQAIEILHFWHAARQEPSF
jgi:toxin ParE1/3/4